MTEPFWESLFFFVLVILVYTIYDSIRHFHLRVRFYTLLRLFRLQNRSFDFFKRKMTQTLPHPPTIAQINTNSIVLFGLLERCVRMLLVSCVFRSVFPISQSHQSHNIYPSSCIQFNLPSETKPPALVSHIHYKNKLLRFLHPLELYYIMTAACSSTLPSTVPWNLKEDYLTLVALGRTFVYRLFVCLFLVYGNFVGWMEKSGIQIIDGARARSRNAALRKPR